MCKLCITCTFCDTSRSSRFWISFHKITHNFLLLFNREKRSAFAKYLPKTRQGIWFRKRVPKRTFFFGIFAIQKIDFNFVPGTGTVWVHYQLINIGSPDMSGKSGFKTNLQIALFVVMAQVICMCVGVGKEIRTSK